MRIYIVQKGDTLQNIAAEHNVEIDTLMQLNSHISSAEYIVPGMKIKIPKTSIEFKQKREVKKEVEQKPVDKIKVERPLGTMDGIDEKRSELHNMRVPRNKQVDNRSTAQENTFTGKEFPEKEHEKSTFSKMQHDEKGRGPSQNPYDYEPTMNHPFHHERQFPRHQMPRDRQMMPAYYHAPVNHYCPVCMYHWQMHMAYLNQRDPRKRGR